MWRWGRSLCWRSPGTGSAGCISAPLGPVKALGSTGYVQEFADANNTAGVKLALATASTTVDVRRWCSS